MSELNTVEARLLLPSLSLSLSLSPVAHKHRKGEGEEIYLLTGA